MILEFYAVHDSAVGAFLRPMCFRSRGEALRSFADAVANEENGFSAHADHYSFFYCGTFDDSTGVVSPADYPLRLVGARDYVPSRLPEK